MIQITKLAFSICAFIVFVFALERRDQRRKKQISSNGGNGHSDNEDRRNDVPQTVPDNTDRYTLQHYKDENRYWKRQTAIATIALCASIVAAIGAGLAFNEARRQADAALLNTRAWLKVETDQRTTFFQWNTPNGPTITTRIVATNIGNSPAFFVQVFPSLMLGGNVNQDMTKKACSALDNAQWGNTAFMKDPIGGGNYGTSVSWAQVEEFYVNWARLNKESIDKMKSLGIGPTYTLTICTSYQIVGEITRHHSGRVFDVRTLVQTPTGAMPVNIPKNSDMPLGSITLEPAYQGDYAD